MRIMNKNRLRLFPEFMTLRFRVSKLTKNWIYFKERFTDGNAKPPQPVVSLADVVHNALSNSHDRLIIDIVINE